MQLLGGSRRSRYCNNNRRSFDSWQRVWPLVGWCTIPVTRSEYTVGVTGCEKRATYVVVCPQGSGGCFVPVGC